MEFSEEEMRRLAALARLELGEDEVGAYRADLNAILGYVQKLDELDVSDVEPTTHAVELAMQLRADVTSQPFTHEQIVQNAPATHEGMFRVPKVVSEG